MKICPMCGSDVLGGGDVKTCSSCGADLEETKPSRNPSSDDRNAPPAPSSNSTFGDAPIAKSDDLEVVSSGQALWEEQRRDDERTDKIHNTEKAEDTNKAEDPKSAADTQSVSSLKSSVTTITEPNKDAPSLSDLARMRRERLAREAEELRAKEASESTDENPGVTEKTPESAEGSTKSTDTATGAGEKDSSSSDEGTEATSKAIETSDKGTETTEKHSGAPEKGSEATEKHIPTTHEAEATDKDTSIAEKPVEATDNAPEATKEYAGTTKDSDKYTEATGRVETHQGDSVPTLAGLTNTHASVPSAHKAPVDRPDEQETTPTDSTTKEDTPARNAATAKDDDADRDIRVVTQAPQIAYFEGNTVTVPGPHLQNGTTMLISGKPYELKRALSKRWLNPERTMLAAAGLAVGVLISLIFSAFSGDPDAIMFGAVRDMKSGQLLPGVTISIDELGETVQTDPLGMFHFEGVEGGVYTLSGSDPIYGVVNSRVSVAGDMTSVLLDLEKPSTKAAAPPPQTQSQKTTTTAGKTPPKKQPAKQVAVPGKVAVAASVTNAEIYLDGRLLGVGNGVYDNIKAGNHTLIVTRDGYTTWEQKIKITGGETARFEPTLMPKDEIVAVQMTAKQYYERARQAYDAGNYSRAISDFDAAINIERNPSFFAWRAEANLAVGNVVRAEHDYINAIDAFDAAQEYARLDQLYERAVQALSSSAEIWFSRAEYSYRRSKPTTAVRSYKRAMELGADAKACWVGIGLAEYARGNFQQANDAWTAADDLGNRLDNRIAGYLALASAWLQFRTSCRNAVRRVEAEPKILKEFRGHPDWEKVQRLTGGG